MPIPKPLVLTILDGWGVRKETYGNAIAGAHPENYLSFLKKYPHTTINAAGHAVGLPGGQMGNSEVGHLNIGAGRVVYQEYTRISKSIADGDFFENTAFLRAIENVKKKGTNLHLMGLLSDGGVHSHNTHLYALLELCRRHGINPYLHLFLDGRDVPPKSALTYIEQLEEVIAEKKVGKIATISGRYYDMDRDNRWNRVKLAYDAIVYKQGLTAKTPKQAVEQSYKEDIDDEFVKPTIIQSADYPGVGNNDSAIFFNFRSDRARELTESFISKNFTGFDRGVNPPTVYFVSLTQYEASFNVEVAYPPIKLDNILADVLAAHHKKQLRIAETEKYAHVTFFFNGGDESPRLMEDRVLIPSPKVATYDLQPEMSAYEVTDALIKELPRYDVVISNFANPDMVGHTGIYDATVKAIQVVDKCLGRISKAIFDLGGEMIITADHGNCEKMFDAEGKPFTAHTNDITPFIYLTNKKVKLRSDGILADIAPTILDILNIEKPEQMTGKSLII
jgi:2,3-bisphosphoglycerate-independent phosphoglycerate mutase